MTPEKVLEKLTAKQKDAIVLDVLAALRDDELPYVNFYPSDWALLKKLLNSGPTEGALVKVLPNSFAANHYKGQVGRITRISGGGWNDVGLVNESGTPVTVTFRDSEIQQFG